MHGLGNNYLYIDLVQQTVPSLDWGAFARRASDRDFGVGSDGVILILPSRVADFRMRMFNIDGSEGEMCGNGIRCVAKYVYDNGLTAQSGLQIETGAGILHLDLAVDDGVVTSVRVDMGEPRLRRGEIPMTGDADACPVLEEPLDAAGERFAVTGVSMGNPHGVIFVHDADSFAVERVGPELERHPVFPHRANIEFIQVLARDSLRMRVWERGSGQTKACGTGACAALVAAALLDKADRRATVHLDGGPLQIEWAENNRVYMTGPAEEICRGRFSAAWMQPFLAPVTSTKE